MDIDVERLVADYAGPALFAGLAVFAWLSLVAGRLEKARGLVELGREALKLREGQERLQAAGKPAPHLESTRRVEAGIRALLGRHGLVASGVPKPASRR